MDLWNLSVRGCAAALLVAGVASMTACESGGLEAYGRAPLGWVAPEGGDGWPSRRVATPAPARPAPAPAPAARPAPAPAPAPSMAGDAMYLPTGDRATSALSLRCNMPNEVIAGRDFAYTLEVCNLTSMPLSNVVVTYTLDGARLVSAEPGAQGNGFPVGELAPRECKTIRMTANAAGTGSVRGCAGATWSNALCCGTNVVQPALRIVKSVTPESGTPCDNFVYKVVVTNTGTGAATNVKVNDTLPAGITSDGKSALSFDAGTLAAGQSREFTFPAKVGKTGSYSNDAQATGDGNLSATSNSVAISVKAPVLGITKTCPGTLRVGAPSRFKIVVNNKGDAPAVNTVVEDTLPSGATFVSASDGGVASGGKIVWNLGTLAPGASKELDLTVNTAGMGTVQNNVMARAVCAEAVTANCSYAVQGSPDIGTLLTDDEGLPLVGEEQVYRYEVVNQGQVDLTNISVDVTLPSGVTYVSSTSPRPPAVAGNKLTFTGVTGVLKPGEKRAFTLTLKSSEAGEKVITSETKCDQLRSPVRNDELTNFLER